MTVKKAAEFMLSIQTYQSAQDLARQFGVSQLKANDWISSICNNARYTVVVMGHGDDIKISVESIDGRKRTIQSISNEALLFQRPRMLVG